MLIAIMIFAIITSFLYFTFVTSERGTRLTLNSSKPYTEARVVFGFIRRKLLEFNYIYPVFLAKEERVDGQSFPNLYFSGLSHVGVPFNSKTSRENLNYFYAVSEGTKNRTYELIYKESYFKTTDGNISARFRKIVVAKNIEFLSIKYLALNQNLWVSEFNYFKYNEPPTAVKISVGILSGSGNIKKFTYRFNM